MAVDENGILTAKIVELADYALNPVINPLFALGNSAPSGEAYKASAPIVKSILQRAQPVIKSDLPIGTDLETILEPGIYRIPLNDYNDTNYPQAAYFQGMLFSNVLGDVFLMVEILPSGGVMQHLYLPFSDYAIFTRFVYPRHLSVVTREWQFTFGVGTLAAELDSAGEKTARSIEDLINIRYAGVWFMYNTEGSAVTPTLLNAYDLPVPDGFTTGYPGYNCMKIEYRSPDYNPSNNSKNDNQTAIKQTLFYSKLAIGSNGGVPSTFTRNVYPTSGSVTKTIWREI